MLAAAGAAIGAAGYYIVKGSPTAKKVEDKVKGATGDSVGATPKKAFTGGDQSFVPLTLQEVQPFNHNTQIFRFKLPEDDMVSGLVIASAILTKHHPEGAEKPVMRPYTPISEEGKSTPLN